MQPDAAVYMERTELSRFLRCQWIEPDTAGRGELPAAAERLGLGLRSAIVTLVYELFLA